MEERAHIAAVYCLQTSISKVDEFGHNKTSIKDMKVEKDGSAALGAVFPEGETDRKVADQLNSIGDRMVMYCRVIININSINLDGAEVVTGPRRGIPLGEDPPMDEPREQRNAQRARVPHSSYTKAVNMVKGSLLVCKYIQVSTTVEAQLLPAVVADIHDAQPALLRLDGTPEGGGIEIMQPGTCTDYTCDISSVVNERLC